DGYMIRAIILGVSLLLIGAETARSDDHSTNHLTLAEFLDYETVGNPQISPDGEQILYTRTRVDKINDRRVSTLWLMDADGGRNRQLMEGSGGRWSPDGTRIAFVRADANETPQLFVRYMDAEGLETQVTSFEFAPSSFKWSPDSKQLAFVARVAAKPDWTIELPARPKGAKWTDDPVIIDDLHYRQDRVGYTNTGYDHIFVVPAEGGTPRQLTEGKWNVGQRVIGAISFPARLSWSPDGRTIAFDGPGQPIDVSEWYVSRVNLIDVDTGDIEHITSEDAPVYGNPVFSPDGSTIAYSGYPARDLASPVGDVYVYELGTGEHRALTSDLFDSPQNLYWSPDGRRVYFSVDEEGDRNIRSIDLRGRLAEVSTGDHVVTLSSVSDNGQITATVSAPDAPIEVALIDTPDRRPELERMTAVNADLLHGKTLGRVEEVWYDATAETGETARVQGWIVYPPDYDEAKEYPLILSIHGGPHAMYNTGFNYTFQEMAAAGYVVLYTNPRGSTGYGSDFANAIMHRYPGAVDYADLMAGVDLVIDRGIVDPERLFVTGCSGGGVLTTWVIAQTDRFKAAAALCPVTNWIGFSGTTDVVGWIYSLFPTPFWEDATPWLEHSTLMHVDKVSTPTLLMTGTEDLRTPLGEAEAYFAALKMRGVPTRLIPMNGEAHGTRSIPSNYLRTSLMLRKWFDEFDPAKQDEETTDLAEAGGD
ncbi:MAG: S9 family peptidase, partial [Pseudomonadota bacterium]